MVLLPPLPVVTVNTPVYVPAASPVRGRTLTVEEPPADIELNGDAVISKDELPVVMLALTEVNETVPVFAIVTDCDISVPYPAVADGNVMLVGVNVHTGVMVGKVAVTV